MKNHQRLILSLAGLKLLLHFSINTNYGLHRDEYLYYDMANHLGWGYMEVPPMIALFSKIASWLGGSVFAIRLFPALIGALSVFLIGHLVKSLGGKTWAILIACFAFILSPAYLGSNNLFQPVSFNQFFWFLHGFILIKIIQTEQPKYWYFLGLASGLAFLTKYSILFYALALIVSLLLTKHRRFFATKHPYLAMLIALIIALPNLIWQYQLGFPVVDHMQELASSQLVNVKWSDFIFEQLLMQSSINLIWVAGLVFLFTQKKYAAYRFLAFAWFFTLFLILSLSGKAYYTLGSYPILFVFGGLAWDVWLKKAWAKGLLIFSLLAINLIIYPYAIPVFKVDKMEKYCAYMAQHLGLDDPLRWENGRYYSLPQDYADMHGWDEMAQKVIKLYQSLPEAQQKKCMIYGGNYGHAGALNYFGKKHQLPEAFSYNSSYQLWLEEDYDFDIQIQVEDNRQGPSQYFHSRVLIDSIENRFARDPGYIYLNTNPKVDVKQVWKEIVREIKGGSE